jgi:protein-S-isoprenylcysteine O-methyltransferase Ste14
MRRARIITVVLGLTVALLAFAPVVLAARDTGGQGWYGETNDKVITNAMYITIAFFPTVIVILSLIQWRLEKRRHARMSTQKARAASADWRGGW